MLINNLKLITVLTLNRQIKIHQRNIYIQQTLSKRHRFFFRFMNKNLEYYLIGLKSSNIR